MDLLGVDIRSKKVADFLESRSTFVDLNTLIVEGVEKEKSFTAKDQGIGVSAGTDMLISCVFLYGQGTQGCKQYVGDLPHRLSFGETSAETRKKLGTPEKSGRGEAHWDRYNLGSYYLHLQYENDRLALVTLMAPEAIPAN